jgi:hypothetical protein
MVGAVLILGLVVSGVVAFVVLGQATQSWARRLSSHSTEHKTAPTGHSPAGV